MIHKGIEHMEKAEIKAFGCGEVPESRALDYKGKSSKNSDDFSLTPSWKTGATDTVFFDGHCGLCHRTVRFLLARDHNGEHFRFAPLDSVAFRASFSECERSEFPESLIVHTGAGEVLTRSTASLYLLQRLGGLWRLLGGLLALAPLGLRDAVYDRVARMRRCLFAAPTKSCPVYAFRP